VVKTEGGWTTASLVPCLKSSAPKYGNLESQEERLVLDPLTRDTEIRNSNIEFDIRIFWSSQICIAEINHRTYTLLLDKPRLF